MGKSSLIETASIFQKRQWKHILDMLHDISGMDLSVRTSGGNWIAEVPSRTPVCNEIRSSEKGRRTCESCWFKCANGNNGEAVISKCPAQMSNIVVPLRVGSYEVFLVGAEARVSSSNGERFNEAALRKLARSIGISADRLLNAYRRTPTVSKADMEQQRQKFSQCVRAVKEILANTIVTRVMDELKTSAGHPRKKSIWPIIGEAVWLLVPCEGIEISLATPARDEFVPVWQDGNLFKKPFPVKNSLRLLRKHTIYETGDAVAIPICAGDNLVGLFRIKLQAGIPRNKVVFRHVQRLAIAIADDSILMRHREGKRLLARIEPALARTDDHRNKLGIILRGAMKTLGCENGFIVLTDPQDHKRMRTIACEGKGSDRIPYFLPGNTTLIRKVMRSGRTSIVADARDSVDYDHSIRDIENAADQYTNTAGYIKFLRQSGACIVMPLRNGRTVCGVMSLHRRQTGMFDIDQVNIVHELGRSGGREAASVLASDRAMLQISAPERELPAPETLESAIATMTPQEARENLGKALSEAILKTTDAFRAAVRLISPDQATLGWIGKAGDWPQEYGGDIQILSGRDTAAKYAFISNKSYLIEDTRQKGIHFQRVGNRVRSHASIVLPGETQPIGIISIDWLEPGAFDSIMIQKVETLASRYAMALRTVGVDQFFIVLEQILNSAGNRQPSYYQFLHKVAEMVGTDQGAIFLRRPDTGCYHLATHLFHPKWSGEDHFYEPGEGITGWIAANNRPLRIRNLRNRNELKRIDPNLKWKDKLYDGEDRKSRNFSFIGVPISVGNNVLGVMRLASPHQGNFSCNDLQIALAAASRLAGFLFKREEAKRKEALMKLSSIVPDLNSQRKMAEEIFKTINHILGPSACHIRIRDKIQEPDGKTTDVMLRLAASDPAWERTPYVRRLGEGIAGRVWDDRKDLYYPDIKLDSSVKKAMMEDLQTRRVTAKIKGGACVLIQNEGQIVGTLHVHKKDRHAISPSDFEFIREVGCAGRGLIAIGKTEEESLRRSLDEVIDRYLQNLLVNNNSHQEEKALLKNILKPCLEAFRSEIGWIRVPDEAGQKFFAFHANGVALQDLPPISFENTSKLLGPNHIMVTAAPLNDTRIFGFAEKQNPKYRNTIHNGPACVIAIQAAGKIMGLLTVVARNPERISYNRAVQTRDMLMRVGEVFELGRRFEMHQRDAAVSRPLALLGALFSRLQHQTRRPVDRIVAAIDYLLSRKRTRKEMYPYLEIMRDEGENLEAILSNMISLVGLSNKDFRRINLCDVIVKSSKSISEKTKRKMPALDLPDCVWVNGSENYLEAAFDLIIRNALEAVAGKHDGIVSININESDEWVRVTIKDNGPGIPAAKLEHVLEPYYTTKPDGTGLGLSSAYCVIRSHDGNLSIESKEGEGTKVIIRLHSLKGGI